MSAIIETCSGDIIPSPPQQVKDFFRIYVRHDFRTEGERREWREYRAGIVQNDRRLTRLLSSSGRTSHRPPVGI
ncbi:MAG: hypothetical protein HY344_02130 [Candidatus Levybacteria bacterium]|nr:hypothetical protein [Candidatus Levybacteria bacterium]